jgi:hypothetical protein
VIAIISVETIHASAIGVTRFVAPGPLVAMQTPTRACRNRARHDFARSHEADFGAARANSPS